MTSENLSCLLMSKDYQLVYLSPEKLLTDLIIREVLRSEKYLKSLVCLAVDETHCIEKWYVYS